LQKERGGFSGIPAFPLSKNDVATRRTENHAQPASPPRRFRTRCDRGSGKLAGFPGELVARIDAHPGSECKCPGFFRKRDLLGTEYRGDPIINSLTRPLTTAASELHMPCEITGFRTFIRKFYTLLSDIAPEVVRKTWLVALGIRLFHGPLTTRVTQEPNLGKSNRACRR
jgi:hypothetical protein